MGSQRQYPQFDFSGAVQNATSYLLKKTNEVLAGKNALFTDLIGAITRRKGYEQVSYTIEHGKDGLYGGVYRYGANNKIVVGVNNSGDTAATLRYLNSDGYWNNILTDAAPNTRFSCLNSFGEMYVAGISDNDTYYELNLIKPDLTTTRTYNVLNAPKTKFITEFQGPLYAIGCQIGNNKYPERVYFSSPPIGEITYVQTDQKGLLNQLRVDSVRYLKPGMQVDIYGAGTEAKKQSAITIISVDKKNQRISFTPTSIDVADNDEIWLTGRKGQLTRFWNTDYPNAQHADFFKIPTSPDSETVPEIIGYGNNNGRLFFYTPDSFYKFDGANLVAVSESIGCVAPESIKNIGKWTLWLHSSGVWGYNDDTGQFQLLSRAVDTHIRAIKPVNYGKISAGVKDRTYKLMVGELLDLTTETTSTSTSSTSTSSTSSSTSSTSTSSTSTSSTSSSTSRSTTSTSSTSFSTSSTSVSTSSTSSSTSSTSISTSTSSTSTSTAIPTKETYRLCYSFDDNTWWVETHKREMRFQFRHRMHGYKKLYFIDETGRLFRDETTNRDHVDTIPFEVELGRDNFGTNLVKNYHSVIVDVDKAEATQVLYSINGGQFKTLGQITGTMNQINFPFGTSGYSVNYKFVNNDNAEGPSINGLTTYYSSKETQGSAG